MDKLEKDVIQLIKSNLMQYANPPKSGIADSAIIEKWITDIMALGYNNGDVELAVSDIVQLSGANSSQTYNRVVSSSTTFKKEVDAFSYYHKQNQLGVDSNVILKSVKGML